MARWLVLGCATIGHDVIQALARGSDELRVVDTDSDRIETLRGEGIDARHADPGTIDPGADEFRADLVLLASSDIETNIRAAKDLRAAGTGQYLVAIASGAENALQELAAVVDSVIDSSREIAARLEDVGTGPRGARFADFTETLGSVSGRLGVFMHTDPDPDAIGSAIALRDVARSRGLDADACYFGEIAHQENRALVNLLDLDLLKLDADTFDAEAFGGYALVDHGRPGVNDGLPAETAIDIVIDHHPPRGPIDGDFVDLRSDVGATSTLLVDYLDGLGVDPDASVATALLYGIRVDTRDFGREITQTDFEAAAELLPRADMEVLERVESPSISGETFDTIARAIKGYDRAGSIVVSSAGRIGDRDAIAQAADQLLEMQDVTLTIVFGILDGSVYVSGRSRASELDVGELMRRSFDDLGSAGGHADMAGAQLSVGILGDIQRQEESLEEVIETVIRGRLYEELDIAPEPIHSDVEGLVTDLEPTDRAFGDEGF